jgi:hypothetical protein
MSVEKTPAPATGATTRTDWAEAVAARRSARADAVKVFDMGSSDWRMMLRTRRDACASTRSMVSTGALSERDLG